MSAFALSEEEVKQMNKELLKRLEKALEGKYDSYLYNIIWNLLNMIERKG